MPHLSTQRICCCLLIGLCFMCARTLCAQKRAAYILDTAPAPQIFEPYRISFSTSSKAITVSFPLRGPHAFNVRAEYFRTSSLPRTLERLHGIKADWKFRSVPVTASYTYALPSPTSWIFPVAGIGLSAHMYRQTEKIDPLTGQPFRKVFGESEDIASPFFADKTGLNVGAEISLGLIMNLSENIFVMAQSRYRYVACSRHRYGYNYNALNVLDFSMDVGFQF